MTISNVRKSILTIYMLSIHMIKLCEKLVKNCTNWCIQIEKINSSVRIYLDSLFSQHVEYIVIVLRAVLFHKLIRIVIRSITIYFYIITLALNCIF